MKDLLVMLVVVLTVFSCDPADSRTGTVALPYYNTPDLTPRWIEPGDAAYDSIHTVAPFSFVNQNGDTVTNEAMDNKVYVANFFFTICPGVCPRMNGNLKLVQEAFADDDRVKILSHSVMPWVDTVGQLHRYAERNEIDSTIWQLVTGNKDDIYEIARTSYFADEGFGKGLTSIEDFLHTEKVILVDRQRRLRGIYNGTLPLDIKRMIEDIKQLM